MQGFLSPITMFGPPPRVARNAVNIQLIMQPLSPSSIQVLGPLLQLHAQQFPVRIGVFFVLPESDQHQATVSYKKMTPTGQFLRCGTTANHELLAASM